VAKEKRIMIKSPNVSSYDKKPEMNAGNLTNELIKYIQNNAFDFICVNYANPDMVGHTGNLEAGIKAVEFIDKCLGRLINAILKKDGIAFVTADHGNIEEMIDLKTGEIDTSHSTFPVPFIIVKKGIKKKKMEKGVLANIAPTILYFLNKNKPKEMNKETLCL
jgi:2,3-bisphosphoglycerate-independent phosphoglycerate mutase